MIDFTRAFETAWERTQVILFQPFDFGKWCAIGLSAFLAGFLEGGNGLNARQAFMASLRLMQRHPGSMAIFILLRIAIFIGVAISCYIICCLTCCLGMLPYVGTVILLPVLIYVKCFTLDCLEQFGPECNVWTVGVEPVSRPQPPG